MISRQLLFALLLVLLYTWGCNKEEIYTYGVNDVAVEQPGAVKPNVKSDLEVISIAHTDLFGTVISPNDLTDLATSYQAFGDKRLIIDMIILNFLNEPGVEIPSDADMRGDIEKFVQEGYNRFFVRQPTAFEEWFISDIIRNDTGITPELVYYAFMTSNEYRYY